MVAGGDPDPGTYASCASCGNDIVFVGPHWDHAGELKPRHPALPMKPDAKSGLTPEEQIIMASLLVAWEHFKTLVDVQQEDKRDFVDAIHAAQSVLMARVVRRDYPEYWR